ncbi:DNA polymerase IV [Methylolobus aquaticus]
MSRRIAHLDMDAFYASVELLRYPQLRGSPVVVGGRRSALPPDTALADFPRLRAYVGRGVATTANYEARALGVRSAMGLMKAAVLAPDAILLPADFEEYRRYSHRFKAAVAAIAPHLENRSIDEIYIDLTAVPGETVWVAQRLKDQVRAATGLSSSIGVAPNKLLAKIASELDKPDGLTVLTREDLPTRIWPLPPRAIPGIGPKASDKLEQLGLRTIGDLAQAAVPWLMQQFGPRYGLWLSQAAQGVDERPVVQVSEPKSISRETTFARDLDPRADRPALTQGLTALCDGVSRDLIRKGYRGKTIGIKLRYQDFRTITRAHTLAAPTDDPGVILSTARACLKRVPLDHPLRLLGIRAAALHRTAAGRESSAAAGGLFADDRDDG